MDIHRERLGKAADIALGEPLAPRGRHPEAGLTEVGRDRGRPGQPAAIRAEQRDERAAQALTRLLRRPRTHQHVDVSVQESIVMALENSAQFFGQPRSERLKTFLSEVL
jgi:hypothetical protein